MDLDFGTVVGACVGKDVGVSLRRPEPIFKVTFTQLRFHFSQEAQTPGVLDVKPHVFKISNYWTMLSHYISFSFMAFVCRSSVGTAVGA